MRQAITVHSDSHLRDGFLEGAARAFFVCAYADWVEDPEREDGIDYPGASMGEDWCNVAPERTPPQAYAIAGELWAELAHSNPGVCGVYGLANLAKEADGEDPDPYDFGWYFAMQYMGHGVSWFDDHKAFPVAVPYGEVTMFSFDPEAYKPK